MSTRIAPSPPPHTELFPRPAVSQPTPSWPALIVNDIRELARFWPVVQNMVMQELRVRYHRSMLGFLWSLLNPILMMTTLAMVFSQIVTVPTRVYAIYLFAGMVPWIFLQGSLVDCSYCIISNEGLIRKIYLPKLVFPLSRVLINLITFLLSMGALFLLLKPLGAPLSLPMVLLPVAFLLFAAFALGLGLIVAVMNTFYRDCGHLVTVVLQAWYFLTPILYEVKLFPEELRWRFWLNPAYPFIKLFQDIISDGQWPSGSTLWVATAMAAVCLGAGYAAFKSYEDKLVFRL